MNNGVFSGMMCRFLANQVIFYSSVAVILATIVAVIFYALYIKGLWPEKYRGQKTVPGIFQDRLFGPLALFCLFFLAFLIYSWVFPFKCYPTSISTEQETHFMKNFASMQGETGEENDGNQEEYSGYLYVVVSFELKGEGIIVFTYEDGSEECFHREDVPALWDEAFESGTFIAKIRRGDELRNNQREYWLEGDGWTYTFTASAFFR